jgi:hypothetical protein
MIYRVRLFVWVLVWNGILLPLNRLRTLGILFIMKV